MAALFGQTINSVLNGVVIFPNNTGITSSNQYLTDGAGIVSPLGLSTNGVQVNGTFSLTGYTLTTASAGQIITSTTTSLGALTTASNLSTIGTITSGIWNGTIIGTTYGGLGANLSIAQGDILYGSAPDIVANLPLDSNATRYLSNTGTNNNPAWAQINLGNGVTGNLSITNLAGGTGASSSTFFRGDNTWTNDGIVTEVTGAGLASGSITSSGAITVTAAVKSDQLTATSTSVAVVPNVQQNHPSAAKAWLMGSPGAVIEASYGVTSLVANSTGNYTVQLSTNFTSANYIIMINYLDSSTPCFYRIMSQNAGNFTIQFSNYTNSGAIDPTYWYCVLFGTQ